MGFRYRCYRRFFGKAALALAALFFLGCGAALGFCYEPSRGEGISFAAALKGMFFYGGELRDMAEVIETLPELSESEQMDRGSLERWEVTYYHDERTDAEVPVFYGEATDVHGVTAAMGSALIRVAPGREVALTALAPEKTSVLIYCTHTAESYDGKADENGRGEVLAAAHHLGDTLSRRYGIGAVVSDTVHDSPDWHQSYTNSKATAAELLAQYPEGELIIDFHRDAGVSKEACTVEVAGKKAATLLLVVGSNVTLEHPHWEENWATAKALGACIDEVDGGLLRGIRVQKGRYNQHLSLHCILLEVGTDRNTLEEVNYSTELVAEAIAKYLQK